MKTLKLALSAAVAVGVMALFAAPVQAAKKANGEYQQSAKTPKKRMKKAAKRATFGYRTAVISQRRLKNPHYGWVVNSPVAVYNEGIRYNGGTPKGPAMWYNNGLGGFNAKLFWTMYDRYAPG